MSSIRGIFSVSFPNLSTLLLAAFPAPTVAHEAGCPRCPRCPMSQWKHVMHLIRLLLSGINVLKEGFVTVAVGEHRDRLLAIKSGETNWDRVEAWRLALHQEFESAFKQTMLPERPNYLRANEFLIKARRLALEDALP